jgi:hypothetical protein
VVTNRVLWDLLSKREGWRYEGPDAVNLPGWDFGLAGASRLVVTVDEGSLVLYVHEEDREHHFATVEALAAWLDQNEAKYAGFTDVQKELAVHQVSSRISLRIVQELTPT